MDGIKIFVFSVVILAQVSTLQAADFKISGNATEGNATLWRNQTESECKTSENCGENMWCETGVCVCPSMYLKANNTCIEVLGLPCKSLGQCGEYLANSICDIAGTERCVCKSGYGYRKNSSVISAPNSDGKVIHLSSCTAILGAECLGHEDYCHGIQNAECGFPNIATTGSSRILTKRCQCVAGLRPDSLSGRKQWLQSVNADASSKNVTEISAACEAVIGNSCLNSSNTDCDPWVLNSHCDLASNSCVCDVGFILNPITRLCSNISAINVTSLHDVSRMEKLQYFVSSRCFLINFPCAVPNSICVPDPSAPYQGYCTCAASYTVVGPTSCVLDIGQLPATEPVPQPTTTASAEATTEATTTSASANTTLSPTTTTADNVTSRVTTTSATTTISSNATTSADNINATSPVTTTSASTTSATTTISPNATTAATNTTIAVTTTSATTTVGSVTSTNSSTTKGSAEMETSTTEATTSKTTAATDNVTESTVATTWETTTDAATGETTTDAAVVGVVTDITEAALETTTEGATEETTTDAAVTMPMSCGRPGSSTKDAFGLASQFDANSRSLNSASALEDRSLYDKIVGGEPAQENEICWQAGVLAFAEDFKSYEYCGGSILNPNYVLTAMHCVTMNNDAKQETPIDRIFVTIGAMDFPKVSPIGKYCGKHIKVRRVIVHPAAEFVMSGSDFLGISNDLAILELDESLDFTQDCVCSICLFDQRPKAGEECIVSGYGCQDAACQSPPPHSLSWLKVPIVAKDSDQCQHGDTRLSTDGIVCIGSTTDQDACQGDSGGPLFCYDNKRARYYLAGATSYGYGGMGRSCAAGQLTRYTDVANYIPWIRENTQD